MPRRSQTTTDTIAPEDGDEVIGTVETVEGADDDMIGGVTVIDQTGDEPVRRALTDEEIAELSNKFFDEIVPVQLDEPVNPDQVVAKVVGTPLDSDGFMSSAYVFNADESQDYAEVGRISLKDGVWTFTGDMDETAKLFIESVNREQASFVVSEVERLTKELAQAEAEYVGLNNELTEDRQALTEARARIAELEKQREIDKASFDALVENTHKRIGEDFEKGLTEAATIEESAGEPSERPERDHTRTHVATDQPRLTPAVDHTRPPTPIPILRREQQAI